MENVNFEHFVALKRWVNKQQSPFIGRMDLRQTFAANLRRLRHAKGLSQEELAHQADVNRSYMSRLEKGEPHVGLEIIGKLAEVLKVDPADFLRPVSKATSRRRLSK